MGSLPAVAGWLYADCQPTTAGKLPTVELFTPLGPTPYSGFALIIVDS